MIKNKSFRHKPTIDHRHCSQRRRITANAQRKNLLLKKAYETLSILSSGWYVDAKGHWVSVSDPTTESFDQTVLYPHESPLFQTWREDAVRCRSAIDTEFSFRQAHAAAAVTSLTDSAASDDTIGILNSASSKRPPSSFLNGGDDAEAVLLRSSTFKAVQWSSRASEWYRFYRADSNHATMAHALLYTPNVMVIRNAYDVLVRPVQVDVVTAAGVNVNAISAKHPDNARQVIINVLRERCARALRILQYRGAKVIVLDTMGADPDTAAGVWSELLACDNSPFHNVFPYVVFAVIGKAYNEFRQAFEMHQFNSELTKALS